jgi:hypothetical protein
MDNTEESFVILYHNNNNNNNKPTNFYYAFNDMEPTPGIITVTTFKQQE